MIGAFITIEGLEGVGKSTCISFVKEFIANEGHKVIITREPGGTLLGEKIRKLILESKAGTLSAETETMLMFAARAHHLNLVILPALQNGSWVISDRFTDATFAYQGGGRNVSMDWLDSLQNYIQNGLEPDLTLLLDAPPKIGLNRISNRDLDYFEDESESFYKKVRNIYLDLAKNQKNRIKIIDASASIKSVNLQIITVLKQFIAQYKQLSND